MTLLNAYELLHWKNRLIHMYQWVKSHSTNNIFLVEVPPKPPPPSFSKPYHISEGPPNDYPSPINVQDHPHRVFKLTPQTDVVFQSLFPFSSLRG